MFLHLRAKFNEQNYNFARVLKRSLTNRHLSLLSKLLISYSR